MSTVTIVPRIQTKIDLIDRLILKQEKLVRVTQRFYDELFYYSQMEHIHLKWKVQIHKRIIEVWRELNQQKRDLNNLQIEKEELLGDTKND